MVKRKHIICSAILISNLVERCIFILVWIFGLNLFFGFFKYVPAGENAELILFVSSIVNVIMYLGILIIAIAGIRKCVRDLKKWDQP